MLAGRWFGRLGYSLPLGISQADFIVDIASGDVATLKISGEDARLHCIACAEKFLQAHPAGYVNLTEVKRSILGTKLWMAAKVRSTSSNVFFLIINS